MPGTINWARIPGRPGPAQRRAPAGQALVEFALVLLPLLTLLFGIIEFAWAVYGYTTANSAANAGARRGMVINRYQPDGTLGNSFWVSGNSSNGGAAYTSPSCNPATIVGTVGCNLGVLPSSRFSVILVTPDTFPHDVPVPPGQVQQPIQVTVQYAYIPLINFPLNLSGGYTMTGYAQTQPQ
jgi:Flp pilus assembly protein TadG